jgi:1-acyl-sn-glycerol-3-phosphate acyltransferase
MMAVEAGVPIVPVTISGGSRIMPKGEIRLTPSMVTVTVHEPILTTNYSRENISELMNLTRAKILSALSEEELAVCEGVDLKRESAL